MWEATDYKLITGEEFDLPIETKDGMYRVSYTEDGHTHHMILTNELGENLTGADVAADIAIADAYVMILKGSWQLPDPQPDRSLIF